MTIAGSTRLRRALVSANGWLCTSDKRCVLLLACCLVAACKGGASTPTSPTPSPVTTPTTPPTVSQSVTVLGARLDGLEHVVDLGWELVPQATSYVVEGRCCGGEVAILEEVTAPPLRLSTPGSYCVGVRAKNAAGMSPLASCRILSIVDMRHVIEALFFNSGAYGETEPGANTPASVMVGWPSGATVPINVATNVPSVQHAAVSRIAEQFASLAGVYQMPVIPTPRIEPFLETGAIRVIVPPAEQRSTLCPNIGSRELEGCARPRTERGTLNAGMAVLWADTPWLAAHEVSHLFGLFHVRIPATPSGGPTGFDPLVMQSPRPRPEPNDFSEIEQAAIRLVYSNGFRNGTPKQDFITRGLIHP